jgi:DNA-binding NarL/FixJ family response regulator
VARGHPADLAAAGKLLSAAAGQVPGLGMNRLEASIAALTATLPGPGPDVLTRREREVAELVAKGLTNREIANQLSLSERTAQNHVQHILVKLGLPNRSQVAVWVDRSKRKMSSTPE